MKKVYILLSRTNTVPSRIIRLFKGGRFSHVSIALEPSTDRFYSYARRKIHNPLCGGFISEDIHKGVFSLYPDAPCALYSLEISDEAHERMNATLGHFLENYDKAKYNLAGLLPMSMGVRIRRKWRLTCSQFVAIMLISSLEITLPKDPYLMYPNDFLKIKDIDLLFEGNLCNCTFPDLKDSDKEKIGYAL